jgi:transposase InsO family protein
MSREVSPATGKPYGVARVCGVTGISRSSFYARKQRIEHPLPLQKRGPKPKVSDAELLNLIRQDLETSPFVGEGHRKVWARLKFGLGIRASRARVLRLMRAHHLLSPHRGRAGAPNEHQGTIVTDAPNVMWGADGAKVLTVDDGCVWVFVAIDHWNAECMGAHVCKTGDRFAALEPIAQGVLAQYGGVEHDCARGLCLRMDHGAQYTSDHFQNQIKAWGIAPSFAFLQEPQTNGVAERFIRTLKEQAVYGRILHNLEDVKKAVTEFVETYNHHWRVEKNGYLTPHEMRRQHAKKAAA